MVVAYLDGHYAEFWRFMSAVFPRLRKRGLVKWDPRKEDKIEYIRNRENENREVFGDRVWAWAIPGQMNPSMKELGAVFGKDVDDWTDEERARHLYFYRFGLFERASMKISHILKDLHHFPKRESAGIPDPVAGAYMFWENLQDHFEAGWHTWEPGVDSTSAMYYMVQPFEDQDDPKKSKRHRIYVCGEAYSFEQGWIEGALKSVEMVMDRLGITLPGENRTAKTPEDRKRSEENRDYVGLGLREIALPLSLHKEVDLPNDQHLVFISGQVGFEVPPREPLPSFEEQVRGAVARLRKEMDEAGAQEIVHIRVFLQSMAYYDKFNQIYADEFKRDKEKPARAVIAVNALPFGALVELDAMAKKKDKELKK